MCYTLSITRHTQHLAELFADVTLLSVSDLISFERVICQPVEDFVYMSAQETSISHRTWMIFWNLLMTI